MDQIKSKKHVFSKLFPFFKPYLIPLIGGFVLIFFAAVFTAAAPITEGLITTQLTSDAKDIIAHVPGAGVNFEYITYVLFVLADFYIAAAACSYAYNFCLTNAIQNAMFDLRNAIEKKLQKLPVSYFDKHAYGDILSRITNDVDTLSNALQQSLPQIVNAIFVIIFAYTMMFTINVWMALIALILIPGTFFLSRFIIKKSQRLFQAQQDALGNLNGTVQEKYTGFSEIKLYGKQQEAIQEFRTANQKVCDHGFKAQFISGLMSPLIAFMTYLIIGSIAVFGAINAINGVMTVGNLQAFIRYIWQIFQPLSQVTQLSATIQSSVAAATRVAQILNEEDMVEHQTSESLKNAKGNVTFEQVSFGYTPDKVFIHDLTFDAKSGQTVAIVGPTGAGKTTIINLLLRFYDVVGGCIKIDGVDIRDVPRSELRSNFGMVLQDTWLFHGTIYDNIKYGKYDATEQEIIEAAKIANVHDFIMSLPDGYQTFINEEGTNVSQGEKQLITIARAVLADPSILILDEATSSIDTRLEKKLQKAMQNIMVGRTSFVIAHRLSTIRNADLILVMKDGRIAEKGTHDELLSQKGIYETLYNSQFAEETTVN